MPTYQLKVADAETVEDQPRSYLMYVSFVATNDGEAVVEGRRRSAGLKFNYRSVTVTTSDQELPSRLLWAGGPRLL